MTEDPFDNLANVWRRAVAAFPHKVAAVDAGNAFSYAECDSLSNRLHHALTEQLGYRKGDVLAVAAPNGIEYVTAFWAAMKSGGMIAPMNVRLGSGELRHIIDHSTARVLILHHACHAAVKDVLPECPSIRHVISVGYEDSDTLPYDRLLAEAAADPLPVDVSRDDPAVIMYTSGTTGQPKGAIMRHGDLLFNNRVARLAHGLRRDDVHLLAIPMFHPTALYSLVPTSAHLGSTLVLAPNPNPSELAELMRTHGVTTFFAVPSLLQLFAAQKDLPSYGLGQTLRLIAYSGSRMPVETVERLRALFPNARLNNFFGLTETLSMTHVLPSADAVSRPDCIGKVLPDVRQRILDEQGHDAAPGEVGELHFHRDNVIPGYWRERERLAQSMHGDWFNTGDCATMDADGYVTLKGRTKDMMIVGGENVYSLEVEQCIMGHDQVADVGVVGVPATGMRAHLGELVKAVVAPRPGAILTVPDIKRHCMERLATYKVPQIIEFREHLPRNAAGKLLRRKL